MMVGRGASRPCSSTSGRLAAPALRPQIRGAHPASSRSVRAHFGVRPYTLRQGDTLQSIVDKRELNMKEVLKINPGLDPNNLKEGSSLTLPLGRLSARDRQILDGMRAGNYRLYPVRHGEKLGDILDKRSISMDEFQALNPDVNVNKVKADQMIKLPARKFSAREREMLYGAGAPNAFFFEGRGSWVAPVLGVGALIGAVVFVGMLRARKNDEEYHRAVDEKVRRRSLDLGDEPPPPKGAA